PLEAPEAALVEKGYGDLAAAFAAAHTVIELEVAVGRHTGVPLETRGALAEFDPASGVLTMRGAAKVPHYNRDQVARMLDLPADMVHLIEGHVGGGFGVRGELYPEDVLVCQAALRLKRPVKWTEDRFEHLLAANHSRDPIHRLRAAVAARLQLDPMEVRRRNFIPPQRMPFDRGVDTLGTRVVYDSGNYARLLDKLLAKLDYPALKRELADRRARGEKVGLGIGLFVEKSGLGPADKAVITLEADGSVEIITGAASLGQ